MSDSAHDDAHESGAMFELEMDSRGYRDAPAWRAPFPHKLTDPAEAPDDVERNPEPTE